MSSVPKPSKSQSNEVLTVFAATHSPSIVSLSVLPWSFSHSSGCLLDSLFPLDEGYSGYLDFILYDILGLGMYDRALHVCLSYHQNSVLVGTNVN